MFAIPAWASMSTHCLHLSVVRLGFAAAKIDYFSLQRRLILHFVFFHSPSAESQDGLLAHQRNETYGALREM